MERPPPTPAPGPAPSLEAVLAAHRFGLGVRAADVAAAGEEPRRWLVQQLGAPTAAEAALAQACFGALPGSDTTASLFPRMLMRAGLMGRLGLGRAPAPGADPAPSAALASSAPSAPSAPSAAEVPMGEPRARARLMPYLHAELQARLRFATTTGAPLRERLVGFWSNHLTVSARRIGVVALVGPYEREAIRPHVLGRFEDLLLAATRHPAMLVYLDNWRSVGPGTAAVGSGRGAQRRTGVNENHARELLELHTLGDRNAYTQADVAELALALTGWGLGGGGGGGGFRFDPDAHADGERVLLGRRYAAGGAEQAQAMLRDLARHPATAQHLAGRLWRHFGGDPAQRAAVARLAAAYQRSDGNLQQLSEALVTSPELWAAEPSTRLLRASEWAVAGWRTLGLVPRSGSVAYGELESLGEPPWMAPSPAGWPESTVQPLGPDALLARIDWARDTAARAAPALDVPALLSPQHLGRWLQPATAAELARAESPAQALALLLVSPQGMQS